MGRRQEMNSWQVRTQIRTVAAAMALTLAFAANEIARAQDLTDRKSAPSLSIVSSEPWRPSFLNYKPPRKRRNPWKIDLAPVVGNVVSYLQDKGFGVKEFRDGKKPVAVTATVSLREDLPDLALHLGDKTPESMGAFYASHSGVRWAVIWPVKSLTLRVEGGKDSEFGYLAIAGLHWRHPTRPIAIGVGLPAQMKKADGHFGGIIQFRMNLD